MANEEEKQDRITEFQERLKEIQEERMEIQEELKRLQGEKMSTEENIAKNVSHPLNF